MNEKVKVVCMECGKKWSMSPKANGPYCPKCNGADVEVL
jgi:DNA-directed RNA polymerase subunit RPC12/RpoP